MMKNILYLFTCLVILQCCNLREKDTYNDLPQDKLYVFKAGDTLIYSNFKNQLYDTILVKNIMFIYIHGEHIYDQSQDVSFIYLIGGKRDYICSIETGIDYANIGWKDLLEYISLLGNRTSVHVLNKDINDVYIVSNSNKPNTIITKQVYFSPSYGFVRVIYANNDTFDLYKVIPL